LQKERDAMHAAHARCQPTLEAKVKQIQELEIRSRVHLSSAQAKIVFWEKKSKELEKTLDKYNNKSPTQAVERSSPPKSPLKTSARPASPSNKRLRDDDLSPAPSPGASALSPKAKSKRARVENVPREPIAINTLNEKVPDMEEDLEADEVVDTDEQINADQTLSELEAPPVHTEPKVFNKAEEESSISKAHVEEAIEDTAKLLASIEGDELGETQPPSSAAELDALIAQEDPIATELTAEQGADMTGNVEAEEGETEEAENLEDTTLDESQNTIEDPAPEPSSEIPDTSGKAINAKAAAAIDKTKPIKMISFDLPGTAPGSGTNTPRKPVPSLEPSPTAPVVKASVRGTSVRGGTARGAANTAAGTGRGASLLVSRAVAGVATPRPAASTVAARGASLRGVSTLRGTGVKRGIKRGTS